MNDNQNQYQIRSMCEKDLDLVITLEQTTWKSQSWTYEYILERLEDPFWYCWILEPKINTAKHFVILGYGFQHISDKTNTICYIDNIVIHPDYRNIGLGGILLRHMINYAHKKDSLTIKLYVKTSNKHAYMLYIRHGFRIVRTFRKYYLNKSNAYLMQLK